MGLLLSIHTITQKSRLCVQAQFEFALSVCTYMIFDIFWGILHLMLFIPFVKVFYYLRKGLQRLLSSGLKGYSSDWKSLVRTGSWELDQRREGFLPAALLWGSSLCTDGREGGMNRMKVLSKRMV